MTRTSKSHHTGEAGTAAVLKACNASGWIGEHVRVDYGEDLVFQTNFKSEIDPFRIYAQCKSTVGNPKRVSISRRHVLRWALMGELVVLFLYRKSSDEIFFYEINERLSFLTVWQSEQKTLSIPRSEFSILDAANLKRLEWLSRMRGMSFLVSRLLSSRQISEQLVDITETPEQLLTDRFNEMEAGMFYLFLKYLDFMRIKKGHYTLNPTGHLKGVLERIEKRLLRKIKSSNDLSIHELLTLAVLAEWQDVSGGLGLSSIIMTGASFWLKVFVYSYFTEQGYGFKKLDRLKL